MQCSVPSLCCTLGEVIHCLLVFTVLFPDSFPGRWTQNRNCSFTHCYLHSPWYSGHSVNKYLSEWMNEVPRVFKVYFIWLKLIEMKDYGKLILSSDSSICFSTFWCLSTVGCRMEKSNSAVCLFCLQVDVKLLQEKCSLKWFPKVLCISGTDF